MKTTCLDGVWQKGRDFLGVRYPILCGAMTWISDSTLVKAVSAHGGFGCLAAGNMPGSYEDFVRLVVPELQRRGLFQTEYAGRTLRENLGIVKPELVA